MHKASINEMHDVVAQMGNESSSGRNYAQIGNESSGRNANRGPQGVPLPVS